MVRLIGSFLKCMVAIGSWDVGMIWPPTAAAENLPGRDVGMFHPSAGMFHPSLGMFHPKLPSNHAYIFANF